MYNEFCAVDCANPHYSYVASTAILKASCWRATLILYRRDSPILFATSHFCSKNFSCAQTAGRIFVKQSMNHLIPTLKIPVFICTIVCKVTNLFPSLLGFFPGNDALLYFPLWSILLIHWRDKGPLSMAFSQKCCSSSIEASSMSICNYNFCLRAWRAAILFEEFHYDFASQFYWIEISKGHRLSYN